MTERERDERIRKLVKRDSAALRLIEQERNDRWTSEELMRRLSELESAREEVGIFGEPRPSTEEER